MIYEPGQLIKLIKFSLNFAALQQRLFTVGTPLSPLLLFLQSPLNIYLSRSLSICLSVRAICTLIPQGLQNFCRCVFVVSVWRVCGVCKKVCLWPTYRNHYAVSCYSGNYALPAAQLPFYANRRRLQLQLQLQQGQMRGRPTALSHFS